MGTKKDRYLLPRIDDLLYDLADCCVFSKLDLQQGYHQIRLDEMSIEVVAFSTFKLVYGLVYFR